METMTKRIAATPEQLNNAYIDSASFAENVGW
jgi:hypothetical protein